jgi:putative colanic acid biosynthesis glycosyltransferase
MNKGIARANGQYLLFLNAGDTLVSPDTLQKTKTAAVNSHAFIYGDALEGNAYKPARAPNIVRGMFTHHQAMLYKRKDIERLRYDTLYKIAADYDFTARFLLSLNCHPRDFAQQNLNSGDPQSEPHSGSQKILYCPFPFCNFQPGGISQQQAALGRREQYQIRKNLKLTGPLQNLIITGFQVLAWKLRQIAPALYWRLKSSGNNAPAIAQSDTRPSHPKTPA